MQRIALSLFLFCMLACTGCARQALFALDAEPSKRVQYIGRVGGNPAEKPVGISLKTPYGTIDCSGTLTPEKTGVPPDCADAVGEGTLSCRDGRLVTLSWAATSCTQGVGGGQFSDGRTITFSYGYPEYTQATGSARDYLIKKGVPHGKLEDDNEGREKTPKKPNPRGKSAKKDKADHDVNGSAFFITDDGLLVTNHHVIVNSARVEIHNTVTGETHPATVVASDKETDLAILKVEAPSRGLPLGNAAAVRKGQDVMALGYPVISIQGSEQKATFGRINSLTGIRNDPTYFQTDVPIQPGNSGGPLLDMNGDVVGVNTATINTQYALKNIGSAMTNISYAVKADYLHKLLEKLPKDYKAVARKNVKAATMSDLVERCERSVVLVYVWKKKK